MAKELLVSHTTGLTVYATGRVLGGDNVGRWGNIAASTLDVFVAADWASYDITMTELGTSGLYEADFPFVFFSERAIEIIYFVQAGGTPAIGDTKIAGSLFELMDDWVATTDLRV